MSQEVSNNEAQRIDTIDFNKIGGIIRKKSIWLLLILIATNSIAYIYIRYTKPLYESSAELKLEIKSESPQLGLGMYFEDKNLSIMAGEMEILKSKLLLKKVIDSLDLKVTYFTQGNVLTDEKYPNSPVKIEFNLKNQKWLDRKIYLSFVGNNQFRFNIDSEPATSNPLHKTNEIISTENLDFLVKVDSTNSSMLDENIFFIINSQESLLEYMENNLIVQNMNLNANTISLSFRDHNIQKARDIIRSIYTIYLKYTAEQKSLANIKKIKWLDSQLERISAELEDYESYFEDFTIANRTNDMDADLQATVEKLNLLDSQQFKMSLLREDILEMKESFKSGEPVILSEKFDPNMERVIQNYNELLAEKEQKSLSYRETTFVMRQIENEIQQASEKLKVQADELLDDVNSRIQRTVESKKRLERSFAKIPEKSTQFNKNQRFYKLYEELYLSLMQDKASFEIAIAGLTPDFQILSPASMPVNPVYPKNLFIYSAGFGSGIVICFFFIGFVYLIDNKISSVEELERLLPYPFLGTIPKSKTKSQSRLLTENYPKSNVVESLRNIRANLPFVLSGNTKTLSVSSLIGGEGKTFFSINLASVLASAGKKVILLDLDMRKPKIHKEFNLNNDKGLSTILIGKNNIEENIYNTPVENMYVIPSGPIPPNPSELLVNGEFKELIQNLNQKYDYIVIDTPPVGLVADGLVIAKNVGLMILIIRSGYADKGDLKYFKRQKSISETNIATVLNGVKGTSRYGYYYGYYSEDKK